MNYTIQRVTEEAGELEQVRNELYRFNQVKVAAAAYEPIHFSVRDGDGSLIAGLVAHRFGNGVFLDILWVAEAVRKQGIGSQLLAYLEAAARSSKAGIIHLDTHDFQAPDFYLKNGYEVFGILEHVPLPGMKRYFMKKSL